MKICGAFPFLGTVVWLTPEQGGRSSGPWRSPNGPDFAATGFVSPRTADNGSASFVLRGFREGVWVSEAEGRWLVVENDGDQLVQPGSIVVVTEGVRVVAYFHVERLIAASAVATAGPRT